MSDLITEVLKSNELRMDGDYSFSLENGNITMNQPSLNMAMKVGQSMTPGVNLSGIGSAIASGVDAGVEGIKGVAKGVPIGLSNFAKEFNKTFLPGYEENVVPFLNENVPGLKSLNQFTQDIFEYKNKAQEIGGGFIGEPLGEFGVSGGALSGVAKTAGIGNRFLANVLGYGTAEVIAVPVEEQGLLSMGIEYLSPDSPVTTAILESLKSDEDQSVFIQKLQKAPENFFVGGVVGEQLDKAVRGVGTLYKYIKNSPKLDSIKQELKGGISNLGDKAREFIEKDGGGTRLGANDMSNIIAQGVKAIDETINPQTSKPDINEVKEVLTQRANQMKLKPAERVQPSGKNKLFDTSPQSYEKIETEQKDIAVPRNTVSNIMPLRNRTQKVVEMSDQIAEVLAKRMEPVKGTNVQFFYHTGPLIAKAVSMGIPKEKAVESLKKFALNYAVTSPRTMTEQNLRNASLVSVKENLNKSLDTLIGPGGEGVNEKGYPMMINPGGIHKKLIDDKNAGTLDVNTNPKPISFAENVSGNLEPVTVDTHAIRAVFDAMNEIDPGSVPIDFIGGKTAKKTKEFQEMYRKDPSSLNVANMINDTLASQMIDGKSMQTEYSVFVDIYKKVAEKGQVRPAEAQSLSWFANGDKTGLASEPKTVVDLIDDRVDVTAQVLKKSKEEVFKKFFEGSIPLLAVPAGVTLLDTGAMMEGDDG